MISSPNIVPDAARHWRQVFTIVSLDRCRSLFSEMGLPEAMVSAPDPLVKRTQRYLQATIQNEGAISEESQRLTLIFHDLATDYGLQTADSFRAWGTRYIVDDSSSRRLAMWTQLLRRLCGLITPDELSITPPLDSTTLTQVCRETQEHLAQEALRLVQDKIALARRDPSSIWETQLDQYARYLTGEGPLIGTVAMALDLVSLTVIHHRTAQIVDILPTLLSDAQYAKLLEWAILQSKALGMSEGLDT